MVFCEDASKNLGKLNFVIKFTGKLNGRKKHGPMFRSGSFWSQLISMP